MEGFTADRPILVKVSWVEQEIELQSPVQTPEGLRADVPDTEGVITRWFVPWCNVTYIRQRLDAPTQTTQPTIPPPPPPPIGD